MTDQTAPPAAPAPIAAPAAAPGWIHTIATKIVAMFKALFGFAMPAMTWAVLWADVLTGFRLLRTGVHAMATTWQAAVVAVLLMIGAYLLGHHEANRAWEPTAAALKIAATKNVELNKKVADLEKPRAVPVCLPAAPAAPTPVVPKARRRQAAAK